MSSERELSAKEVTDIYRRYGFFLQRRCRLLLRDNALADDALQEAFVRVLRRGSEFRTAEFPLRWLYRVVDRCCFDQLRARKKGTANGVFVDMLGPHPNTQIEVRNTIVALLTELDETDQAIATLAFVDGLTQEEIASELGVSRVTINKHVQSIREKADRLHSGSTENL